MAARFLSAWPLTQISPTTITRRLACSVGQSGPWIHCTSWSGNATLSCGSYIVSSPFLNAQLKKQGCLQVCFADGIQVEVLHTQQSRERLKATDAHIRQITALEVGPREVGIAQIRTT